MSHPDYQYWYAFCFMITTKDGAMHATCYIGRDEMNINMNTIAEAKRTAKVDDEAVMISCSFLGLMTREAFTGENIDRAAEG